MTLEGRTVLAPCQTPGQSKLYTSQYSLLCIYVRTVLFGSQIQKADIESRAASQSQTCSSPVHNTVGRRLALYCLAFAADSGRRTTSVSFPILNLPQQFSTLKFLVCICPTMRGMKARVKRLCCAGPPETYTITVNEIAGQTNFGLSSMDMAGSTERTKK